MCRRAGIQWGVILRVFRQKAVHRPFFITPLGEPVRPGRGFAPSIVAPSAASFLPFIPSIRRPILLSCFRFLFPLRSPVSPARSPLLPRFSRSPFLPPPPKAFPVVPARPPRRAPSRRITSSPPAFILPRAQPFGASRIYHPIASFFLGPPFSPCLAPRAWSPGYRCAPARLLARVPPRRPSARSSDPLAPPSLSRVSASAPRRPRPLPPSRSPASLACLRPMPLHPCSSHSVSRFLRKPFAFSAHSIRFVSGPNPVLICSASTNMFDNVLL